jgi:CheY-like chemotaxis protein
MPVMDGWSFLEKFEELDEVLRSKIKIWILTSSISKTDKERADGNKHVKGFAMKPFTIGLLKDLVKDTVPG